jgi:hypothetical protein
MKIDKRLENFKLQDFIIRIETNSKATHDQMKSQERDQSTGARIWLFLPERSAKSTHIPFH